MDLTSESINSLSGTIKQFGRIKERHALWQGWNHIATF